MLDLGKGKKAISAADVGSLPDVIATVINAVEAGELDASMDAAIQAVKKSKKSPIGVRVLASLAGHKSIATTQAYIDVNDEMKRAAVELAG